MLIQKLSDLPSKVPKVVAVDTETIYGTYEMEGYSFAFFNEQKKIESYFVPVAYEMEPDEDYVNVNKEKAVLYLKKLCAGRRVVFHNAAFDLCVLEHHGIDIEDGMYEDTMLLHWALDTERRHGLKKIMEIEYGRKVIEYKKARSSGFKVFSTYADDDARYTIELFYRLYKQAKDFPKTWNLYKQYELPFVRVIKHMSDDFNYVRIDRDLLSKYKKNLEGEMSIVTGILKDKLGDINFNSNPQLGKALEAKGIPVKRKDPTEGMKKKAQAKGEEAIGNYTIGESELLKLKKYGLIIDLLLYNRHLEKLYGTYIAPIYDKLVEREKGVWVYEGYDFNQIATRTGRIGCVHGETILETSIGNCCISELNLTNAPNVSILTHTNTWKRITHKIYKGREVMYEVETETGKRIKCTASHRFLTRMGWKELRDIKEGDKLYTHVYDNSNHVSRSEENNGRGNFQEVPTVSFTETCYSRGISRIQHACSKYFSCFLQGKIWRTHEGIPKLAVRSECCREYKRTYSKAFNSFRSGYAFSLLQKIFCRRDSIVDGGFSSNCSGEHSVLQNDRICIRTTKEFYRRALSYVKNFGSVYSRSVRFCYEVLRKSSLVLREYVYDSFAFDRVRGVDSVLWRKILVLQGEGHTSERSYLLELQQGRGCNGFNVNGKESKTYSTTRYIQKVLDRFLHPIREVADRNRWCSPPKAISNNSYGQVKEQVGEGTRYETSTVQTIGLETSSGKSMAHHREESVVKITDIGIQDVWDISVEDDASYVAHGFVNHNSGMQQFPRDVDYLRCHILTDIVKDSMIKGYPLFVNEDTFQPYLNAVSNYEKLSDAEKVGVDKLRLSPKQLSLLKKSTDKYSIDIRSLFIAMPGCVFVDADLSQIELRTIAHLAKDKVMCAAFTNGEDLHTQTAVEVSKLAKMKVTRQDAKPINFGLVYGLTAYGLKRGLNISMKDAEKMLNAYFKVYSGIKDFIDETHLDAAKSHYVQTVLGRRRNIHTLGINDRPENARTQEERRKIYARINGAQNSAVSTIVQGSAADLLKIAMINLYNDYVKKGLFRIVMQVHDELLIECKEKDGEKVLKIVKEYMEIGYPLSVPVLAEARVAKTWRLAH